MKASPFEYLKPATLEEALGHLARRPGEARIIAGGQSLVPVMNMRLAAPVALVDINGIASLAGMEVARGALRLGALTRHRELVESPMVAEHAPLLARAAAHIGHEAIRNRGTLGGSLAHADPAAELPACLLALGGRIAAASVRRRRSIDAVDFFLGPYTTSLEPDEMVVGVEIPAGKASNAVGLTSFQELARRQGDFAMAGLSAVARRDGRALRDVRFAFFGVAARPFLARAAAAAAEGREPGPETALAARAALSKDLEPMGDLHTSAAVKAHLAGVLLLRALRELGEGGG